MASTRVRSELEKAIEGRFVVSLKWRGTRRVVYVHRLWIDENGSVLIEVWQAKGPSEWRKYVGWKTMNIDDVTDVTSLGRTFEVRDDFNPDSSRGDTLKQVEPDRGGLRAFLRCLNPRNAAEAARCALIRLTERRRERARAGGR